MTLSTETIWNSFREPLRRYVARRLAEPADAARAIAEGLADMIRGLPEPYRQALELSELEGIPQRKVAERLGISLSGAKSRIQRGRKLLRDALLECCHFDFDRRGRILEFVPRAPCCHNKPSC